jgi:chorismate mutase
MWRARQQTGSLRRMAEIRTTCWYMNRDLAMAASIFIGAIDVAHAQTAIDRLRPLVATSARRLAIAEQVALAKWDSRAEVEDAAREAQVVHSAVQYGASKSLDAGLITKAFIGQIEANKLVQYSLLADWRRNGRAPAHKPVDSAVILLELDRLQTDLIEELADLQRQSERATCQTDIAKAIGKYLEGESDHSELQRVALDRALATVCTL